MKLVRWVAWGCFASAGLMALMATQSRVWEFRALAAVSGVISGILMLALDRIIELLARISAALEPKVASSVNIDVAIKPARTLEELAADLDRLNVK